MYENVIHAPYMVHVVLLLSNARADHANCYLNRITLFECENAVYALFQKSICNIEVLYILFATLQCAQTCYNGC
jgi:hypothetical protein